jgi:hypothetical protein
MNESLKSKMGDMRVGVGGCLIDRWLLPCASAIVDASLLKGRYSQIPWELVRS